MMAIHTHHESGGPHDRGCVNAFPLTAIFRWGAEALRKERGGAIRKGDKKMRYGRGGRGVVKPGEQSRYQRGRQPRCNCKCRAQTLPEGTQVLPKRDIAGVLGGAESRPSRDRGVRRVRIARGAEGLGSPLRAEPITRRKEESSLCLLAFGFILQLF